MKKNIALTLLLSLSIVMAACSETETGTNEVSKNTSDFPNQRTAEEMKNSNIVLSSNGVINRDEWETLDGIQDLDEMNSLTRENEAKAELKYKHKILKVKAKIVEIGSDYLLINTKEVDPLVKREEGEFLSTSAKFNLAEKENLMKKVAEKKLYDEVIVEGLVISTGSAYMPYQIEVLDIQ